MIKLIILIHCTNGIKPNLFEYSINLTKLTFLKLEQRLNSNGLN